MSAVLLDTHALVWLVTQPSKLSRKAASSIKRAASRGGLCVASISLWEIAMLFARGSLRASGTVQASVQSMIDRTHASVLEISSEIAGLSVQLSDDLPADPADRLIVATAIAHALPLITRDGRLQDAELCRTVW